MQPSLIGLAAGTKRRRWTSRRAILLHVAVLVWTPGCALACWWQVTVALSGDSLGWLYSIEWPAFGLFGLIVWWSLIHDVPGRNAPAVSSRDGDGAPSSAGEVRLAGMTRRAESEDDALSRYNDYLEALGEHGRPKTWRRR